MALQSEGHAETVLADKHEIVMQTAKALLVGLDTHLGLHHGCAENEIQLIFFQFAVDGAQRASAGGIGGRGLKGFVDGYGIDLFHNFSPIYFVRHLAIPVGIMYNRTIIILYHISPQIASATTKKRRMYVIRKHG